MFKVLLILTLLFYILHKAGLFRLFFHTQARNQQDPTTRRPAGGNVDIHTIPKQQRPTTFKGGEYVDYEEIKDR